MSMFFVREMKKLSIIFFLEAPPVRIMHEIASPSAISNCEPSYISIYKRDRFGGSKIIEYLITQSGHLQQNISYFLLIQIFSGSLYLNPSTFNIIFNMGLKRFFIFLSPLVIELGQLPT